MGFKYLLVFRLNHVISLSTETGDMSVDIDSFFVFDSLQHRICKMKMLKIIQIDEKIVFKKYCFYLARNLASKIPTTI